MKHLKEKKRRRRTTTTKLYKESLIYNNIIAQAATPKNFIPMKILIIGRRRKKII